MGGAASAVDRLNLRGPPLQVGAMYRSHDSDRDSPHEVGIGPGVTCGLTHRAAPPALYLGCLDALGDVADAGGGGFGRLASGITGARTAALLLHRLVGVGQFVGDDERRQEDQPGLADLPQILGELADLGVDILREATDARLLPVGAAEGKVAAVDLDDDLAHVSPPVRAAAPAWRARHRSARQAPRLRLPPARLLRPGALPDPPPLRAAQR